MKKSAFTIIELSMILIIVALLISAVTGVATLTKNYRESKVSSAQTFEECNKLEEDLKTACEKNLFEKYK